MAFCFCVQASFESMLPEFELFLEWLVANRQNEVEWNLLIAESWREFGFSELRQSRFRALTDACHRYAMACGAVRVLWIHGVDARSSPQRSPTPGGMGIGGGQDVPLALKQQHTWALVPAMTDLETEIAQMRAHRTCGLLPCAAQNTPCSAGRRRGTDAVDWLMAAGFDFLATENGFTEFQPGNCSRSGSASAAASFPRVSLAHHASLVSCLFDTPPKDVGVDGRSNALHGRRVRQGDRDQGPHLHRVRSAPRVCRLVICDGVQWNGLGRGMG